MVIKNSLDSEGVFEFFKISRHKGFVIKPNCLIDADRRWVWFAPAFILLPGEKGKIQHIFYVKNLVRKGFHVAGIDVGNSCGSPYGTEIYQRFYDRIIDQWQLNPKTRLVAQSRGGLMHYNWASQNPRCVDRILGIFPVTDIQSWPGLRKACDSSYHNRSGFDITSDQLRKELKRYNPIEQLKPLALNGIRILHLHGDSDKRVPLERNSTEFARRYRGLGGEIELVIIQGEGHKLSPSFTESRKALKFLIES